MIGEYWLFEAKASGIRKEDFAKFKAGDNIFQTEAGIKSIAPGAASKSEELKNYIENQIHTATTAAEEIAWTQRKVENQLAAFDSTIDENFFVEWIHFLLGNMHQGGNDWKTIYETGGWDICKEPPIRNPAWPDVAEYIKGFQKEHDKYLLKLLEFKFSRESIHNLHDLWLFFRYIVKGDPATLPTGIFPEVFTAMTPADNPDPRFPNAGRFKEPFLPGNKPSDFLFPGKAVNKSYLTDGMRNGAEMFEEESTNEMFKRHSQKYMEYAYGNEEVPTEEEVSGWDADSAQFRRYAKHRRLLGTTHQSAAFALKRTYARAKAIKNWLQEYRKEDYETPPRPAVEIDPEEADEALGQIDDEISPETYPDDVEPSKPTTQPMFPRNEKEVKKYSNKDIWMPGEAEYIQFNIDHQSQELSTCLQKSPDDVRPLIEQIQSALPSFTKNELPAKENELLRGNVRELFNQLFDPEANKQTGTSPATQLQKDVEILADIDTMNHMSQIQKLGHLFVAMGGVDPEIGESVIKDFKLAQNPRLREVQNKFLKEFAGLMLNPEAVKKHSGDDKERLDAIAKHIRKKFSSTVGRITPESNGRTKLVVSEAWQKIYQTVTGHPVAAMFLGYSLWGGLGADALGIANVPTFINTLNTIKNTAIAAAPIVTTATTPGLGSAVMQGAGVAIGGLLPTAILTAGTLVAPYIYDWATGGSGLPGIPGNPTTQKIIEMTQMADNIEQLVPGGAADHIPNLVESVGVAPDVLFPKLIEMNKTWTDSAIGYGNTALGYIPTSWVSGVVAAAGTGVVATLLKEYAMRKLIQPKTATNVLAQLRDAAKDASKDLTFDSAKLNEAIRRINNETNQKHEENIKKIKTELTHTYLDKLEEIRQDIQKRKEEKKRFNMQIPTPIPQYNQTSTTTAADKVASESETRSPSPPEPEEPEEEEEEDEAELNRILSKNTWLQHNDIETGEGYTGGAMSPYAGALKMIEGAVDTYQAFVDDALPFLQKKLGKIFQKPTRIQVKGQTAEEAEEYRWRPGVYHGRALKYKTPRELWESNESRAYKLSYVESNKALPDSPARPAKQFTDERLEKSKQKIETARKQTPTNVLNPQLIKQAYNVIEYTKQKIEVLRSSKPFGQWTSVLPVKPSSLAHAPTLTPVLSPSEQPVVEAISSTFEQPAPAPTREDAELIKEIHALNEQLINYTEILRQEEEKVNTQHGYFQSMYNNFRSLVDTDRVSLPISGQGHDYELVRKDVWNMHMSETASRYVVLEAAPEFANITDSESIRKGFSSTSKTSTPVLFNGLMDMGAKLADREKMRFVTTNNNGQTILGSTDDNIVSPVCMADATRMALMSNTETPTMMINALAQSRILAGNNPDVLPSAEDVVALADSLAAVQGVWTQLKNPEKKLSRLVNSEIHTKYLPMMQDFLPLTDGDKQNAKDFITSSLLHSEASGLSKTVGAELLAGITNGDVKSYGELVGRILTSSSYHATRTIESHTQENTSEFYVALNIHRWMAFFRGSRMDGPMVMAFDDLFKKMKGDDSITATTIRAAYTRYILNVTPPNIQAEEVASALTTMSGSVLKNRERHARLQKNKTMRRAKNQ